MAEKHIYKGIVRSRLGLATKAMSAPGVLEGFQRVMGLAIIPGTLNLLLTERFDQSLLHYNTFAELNFPQMDIAEIRRLGGVRPDFLDSDEQGSNWVRIMVADKYPACLSYPTWTNQPGITVELMSPYHLRTVLNLKDGDIIEFTLDCASSGGTGTKKEKRASHRV